LAFHFIKIIGYTSERYSFSPGLTKMLVQRVE